MTDEYAPVGFIPKLAKNTPKPTLQLAFDA